VSGAGSPSGTVVVAHAGALNAVLAEKIGPAFSAATGFGVECIAGASVRLANDIRRGLIAPDVYLSADVETNALLMGPQNVCLVTWHVTIARNRMALVYSPHGRFCNELDAAASGALPWFEVVQRTDFRFRRNDPRTDPGGYRVLFVLQLAERHYGIPGLKDRILGGDANEEQILSGGYRPLQDGEVDAVLTYETIARDKGLAFVPLPAEIDLSEPSLAPLYATASYTNLDGHTFCGAPALFSATILQRAAQPEAAEAFVRHLLSASGQNALAAHGFLKADALIGGDAESAPPGLVALREHAG
jgi:molybdate/tungstate transport system substrate-binding protein